MLPGGGAIEMWCGCGCISAQLCFGCGPMIGAEVVLPGETGRGPCALKHCHNGVVGRWGACVATLMKVARLQWMVWCGAACWAVPDWVCPWRDVSRGLGGRKTDGVSGREVRTVNNSEAHVRHASYDVRRSRTNLDGPFDPALAEKHTAHTACCTS